MNEVTYGVVGVVFGLLGGFFILKALTGKQTKRILEAAEKDGEQIKTDKILQAKEKFVQLKSEHEKTVNKRNQQISQTENKLKQKENSLNQKMNDYNKKDKEIKRLQSKLEDKISRNEKKEQDLESQHRRQVEQLEAVAGISGEEAKKELVETLKAEARTEAMSHIQDTIEEAKMSANMEAKKIVIKSIQRCAAETAIENAVSVFHIESDEIKGRIIGREGRNIRAIEAATGVEVIVDDTPEAIILSCFDPVRREVARLALQKLVSDGRIHPARVEQVVEKTKKDINQEILNTGKRTVIDLGIHGLDLNLIRMVGRMKYRSSYGQNLLQHSREVANLCAIMASELGLNPKLAKRAGLLHDIGKVPDENPELPHAILGMKLAEKYGESKDVCNAIGAHHDEIDMDNLISPIVQVCDAISGARPGARREVVDAYINRLKELEDLALSKKGVLKAYAIQAGRELRVIVESDTVSDQNAKKISYDLSKQIQKEMTYPGQVKVTVIRETRAINIAK